MIHLVEDEMPASIEELDRLIRSILVEQIRAIIGPVVDCKVRRVLYEATGRLDYHDAEPQPRRKGRR